MFNMSNYITQSILLFARTKSRLFLFPVPAHAGKARIARRYEKFATFSPAAKAFHEVKKTLLEA